MRTLTSTSFNTLVSVFTNLALRVSSVSIPNFVRSQIMYIFAAIFGKYNSATPQATAPISLNYMLYGIR